MTKLKQAFTNSSTRPQFLFLEPNASQYRLNPGETLVLHYDGEEKPGYPDSALSIEFSDKETSTMLVIWTWESDMFHTGGRPAVQDHDPAP